MAITIQQYASNLTMANSDLLWVVTSNSSSRDQYQFICALKDGCGTTLTTIKQQPNPSGKGVFDLGRIVKQYLGYDATNELFQGGPDGYFQTNRETAKFFKVAFGEEYGTSPSSSVTVYTGVGSVTGSAAYTGSVPQYYFINGVLDPNYGSWSWNTSSFYNPRVTPSSASFTYNACLTDAPRSQSARNTDYLTLSILNGNLTAGATSSQDIYALDLAVYNGNTTVFTSSYFNVNLTNTATQGGPRTADSQLWTAVNGLSTCTSSLQANIQTSGSFLIHLPVGPQNISDYGDINLSSTTWTSYTLTLRPQSGSVLPNTNASWDKFTISKTEGDCAYNGVRFGFINNYGVWDWYTFTLANDKAYNLDRGIYKQNFVDYSTTSNLVEYNIARRGQNAYYTNINTDLTANSDWLLQEEADWLEQLFYSPNVYVQDGFNMIPVVITTSTLLTKTNPRSQKNFQYVITYRLANDKRSR